MSSFFTWSWIFCSTFNSPVANQRFSNMPVKVGLNHGIKKAPAQRKCEIKKLQHQLYLKNWSKKKARNETLVLGLFKFNCSVPYVAINSLVLVWFGLSLKIPTGIQTIEKYLSRLLRPLHSKNCMEWMPSLASLWEIRQSGETMIEIPRLAKQTFK